MSSLFEPVKIGAFELPNRIVMAPLTRARALYHRAPWELNEKYYSQRASAGLIISEAISVSPQGVGYANTPGLWSALHVRAWSHVTAGVHREGGRIIAQLWHVGRVSDPAFLGGDLPVAPSALAPSGNVSLVRPVRPYVVPRALDTDEIPGIIQDFRNAAEHAKRAGFDGVELHAANGYLFDQFLHDGSNQRADVYGGSIENRSRFLLDALDAILGVWPADRVGVHLNLMSSSHSMHDSDPAALFGFVAERLSERKLAFIFGRESQTLERRLAPLVREIFGGSFIANEGLTKDSAERLIQGGEADAVSFGKLYIANPDLVERLELSAELNPLVQDTIYGDGATGYTDYPVLR